MDAPVPELTSSELLDEIHVVHGTFHPGRMTVQCIVRDELYFLPSFLGHYRGLGVEQFVFLDDGSSDGSAEFLAAQADCVVLKSRFSYGTIIDVIDAPLKNTAGRFGILARTFISKKLGMTGWAIGVDADEFLLLPPQFSDLGELIASLEARGSQVVKASLVEFYPERIWQPDSIPAPRDLDDLVQLYPYFDAHPLIDVADGEESLVGATASMRLFKTFGIRGRFPGFFPPGRMLRWLLGDPPRTPAHKTPLIKWADDTYLQGSHLPSATAPGDLLLAMAHFKFTRDLDRRTAGAIVTRAYASNSLRYDCYDALIAEMRRGGASFLGPQSRKFESADDFIASGLMYSPAA